MVLPISTDGTRDSFKIGSRDTGCGMKHGNHTRYAENCGLNKTESRGILAGAGLWDCGIEPEIVAGCGI